MAEQITGRSRELLDDGRNFCLVASLRKDGSPHGSLVWVDLEGDQVRVNSARGRAWPTQLEHDPRVALVIANAENPYEYVEIRGRVAEITEDGADAHIDALARKYRGVEQFTAHVPGEVRVMIKIDAETVRYNNDTDN